MATNIPNVSFPYISIKLKHITLTWRGNAPDYFSSLTYERFVNRASKCTINITYAPGPNDNPNAVEEAIVQSQGDALIQYGQVNGRTRQQRCLIYDYKVNMNDGVLQYTLYLVSRSVVHNWSSAKSETFNTDDTQDKVEKYMIETVDKIKINGQSSYKMVIESKDFEIMKKITVGNGQSPFKALVDLAAVLRCKGDSGTDPRYYYAIEVDDSYVDIGRVFLRKIDTQQVAAEYTFNWGTKNADVISWGIDYQGAVALARARGEDVTMTSGINEVTGKMYTYSGGTPAFKRVADTPDLLASVENVVYDSAKFAEYADHCYTASLTVVGQNKTLSIGKSIIQVNPMINGKPHHSKGKYKVIGITDSVNESGFQTTYNLYKLDLKGQNAPIFPKQSENEKPQIYYNGAFHEYSDIDFFYQGGVI